MAVVTRRDLGVFISKGLSVYVLVILIQSVPIYWNTATMSQYTHEPFNYLAVVVPGAMIGLAVTLWQCAELFAGKTDSQAAVVTLTEIGLRSALLTALGAYFLVIGGVSLVSTFVVNPLLERSYLSSDKSRPILAGIEFFAGMILVALNTRKSEQ